MTHMRATAHQYHRTMEIFVAGDQPRARLCIESAALFFPRRYLHKDISEIPRCARDVLAAASSIASLRCLSFVR